MDTFPTVNQEPAFTNSDVDDELMCREPPLSPDAPPPPKQKKAKGFRMQGLNFSLTYPQCDTKKEVAAERIEQKFKDSLKGYIVCEEDHKDGTPHLHVLIQLKERLRTRDPNYFDFICNQHGNYQVTKSVRAWVLYVTKAGNYVAKGVDVESITKKRASKNEVVAKMLHEGKTMVEIDKEDPGYVMINKRKIEEYASWVECMRSKRSKIDWIPPKIDGLTDSNLKIAEWILKNIRQPRAFKAPQLYIHGPRNLGKTSLIEWLEKSLSVYHMPMTEEFYDLYADDFDIVVLDEFKGQKTIQFLNQFLQGSPMPIRKKGSQGMKYKNLPVVILSNYSLSECYVKAANDGRLSTLECRLEIVEVDSFIDFYLK